MLGFNTVMMPLYTWFIGLHALVFGKMTGLAVVLTQGLLDGGKLSRVFQFSFHGAFSNLAAIVLRNRTITDLPD